VPTGRTDSPEAKRNLVERSRPRPRVPRATEGAVNDSTHFNRWQHARVLARIRLTRTAAERGPVLSGACGQGGMARINRLRLLERANAHTPPDA
jgi:hypothetical protein